VPCPLKHALSACSLFCIPQERCRADACIMSSASCSMAYLPANMRANVRVSCKVICLHVLAFLELPLHHCTPVPVVTSQPVISSALRTYNDRTTARLPWFTLAAGGTLCPENTALLTQQGGTLIFEDEHTTFRQDDAGILKYTNIADLTTVLARLQQNTIATTAQV